LVEQRTENPRVAGSIPALAIRKGHYSVAAYMLDAQRAGQEGQPVGFCG
jgi:hypothetical protein